MKLCHIIVGLPGSGKSHFATEMASRRRNIKIYDDVDPRKIHEIMDDCEIIVISPLFCKEAVLHTAKLELAKRYDVQVMYFANEPQQCIENARRRNDGRRVEADIMEFSKVYRIPPGIINASVWRPEDDYIDPDMLEEDYMEDEDPYL